MSISKFGDVNFTGDLEHWRCDSCSRDFWVTLSEDEHGSKCTANPDELWKCDYGIAEEKPVCCPFCGSISENPAFNKD